MEKDISVGQPEPTVPADESTDAKPKPNTVGLEENATGLSLSRTVSGPPYSIYNSQTKLFIMIMVSISSLISPFGATTFYPALNVVAADLHTTPTLINISLTTYMVSASLRTPARWRS